VNHYKRWLTWVIAIAASLSLSAAWAQNTTGSISGVVTDSSGAVIPQARVTVYSSATGFTRDTQTSQAGVYKFSLIPIGVYTVTAQKAGFQTQKLDNIHVEILSTDTANFTLAVGSNTQVVKVNAAQVQLDTQTSQAGTVIQGRQINNLPLNVRQFLQLVFLAPMSTPAVNDFRSNVIPRNTSVPASAGQRPDQNNYELDGFNNRETSRNSFAISPPVDSVQQFIVQTGMAPAEFGQGGGVIVNAVTRGGTDTYHGALYEFIRNDFFDARPYFAKAKSPLKRNQFGAEIGGPIRRHRLTFFANYEGLRQSSQGNPAVGLVPTVAEKQGVFPTTITDPANGNAPFANNTIPQDRINPISKNLLQLFPDPNASGTGYNFIFNNQPSGQLIYNSGLGRIDYNRGADDTFFGRYLYDSEYTSTPPYLPLPAYSGGRIIQLKAQGMGGQWSHVISPALVNTFGLNYTRYHNQLGTWNSYRKDFVTPSGITNTLSATNPLFWATPNIDIPGLLTPGDVTPNFATMNEYQLIENLVWAHGQHTFKFGTDIERTQTDMFYTGANGNWTFSNAYTGNNFADFLLGDASNVGKTARATNWNTWTWYFAGYAEDDWKATKNLTLNLGLRYEVQTAIRQSDHCGLGMRLQGGKATEIISDKCQDLPDILAFSQNIRPDVLVSTTTHDAPYNTDTNNFAPRFGFAYALGTKTVLRGGAGIFYAAPEVTNLASSNDFAPDTLRPIWTSSPTTPTYSWNPEGATSAEESLKNSALTVFPVLSRNLPYGVVQEWNLNVERELTNTLSLQVMYQGSHDVHLFGFDNSDFRAPGPGNVQQLLPYPQYARIQNFDTWGAANYNGGSVRLQQTPARGLSYLVAYTYSKSLDNGSEEEQSPQWSNPFNRATAWGPSDFNATNRFTAAYTYQLPLGQGGLFLANVNNFENKLVGGWGIRGITQYQTGSPQTPTMNLSREGICATACIARPDRIGNGNLPRGVRTMHRFYDVTAFQVLPAGGVSGRIGDAGRNILTGPPINDFDMQLYKQVRFAESQSVEFRWEMYNAFNHTQWRAPSVNMESPSTFGVITSTAPPRIMQFALRYSF
jgi:outer membrane receptor protein involved in Fe transport